MIIIAVGFSYDYAVAKKNKSQTAANQFSVGIALDKISIVFSDIFRLPPSLVLELSDTILGKRFARPAYVQLELYVTRLAAFDFSYYKLSRTQFIFSVVSPRPILRENIGHTHKC